MAQREDVQSPPAGPGTVPPTPTPRRNRVKASGAVVGLSCSVFIFVATCAVVLLSVQLAAMRRNDTAHRETPFCCPREAAKLFAVIDNKAAPCEDFFAYVCRNAIDQGIAREQAAHDILGMCEEVGGATRIPHQGRPICDDHGPPHSCTCRDRKLYRRGYREDSLVPNEERLEPVPYVGSAVLLCPLCLLSVQ
ncbi:uncharacterized protein LOC125940135 [Dermacentor silvarum]|uniref:uncharacterized protein LOC125940135 n=1 Tax=Dermacentor silvarum TaxID=543639 RepID=UPI002101085D|nr:uncharacterized protein LOC125940135 [Dermacentor silvarum]